MKVMRIPTKRWTRAQYERAIDRDVFDGDERIELLDGVLVVKEPQSERHAATIDLVAATLRTAFGPGWLVRDQKHFAAGRLSRPEPDVYVVPGTPHDYQDRAPKRPVLVVEVSVSRLAFDRGRKAAIYARGGVQDYWIVNVDDAALEVRRDPGRLRHPARGWGYRAVDAFEAPAIIAPLAAPDARISVADLFLRRY